MIRNTTVFLLVTTLSLAMAATAVPQEKGDKALQGKWKVTKIIKRGALYDEDRIAGRSFEFAKDKVTFHARSSDEQRTFSFKIDSTKKPKQIDLTAVGGTFDGKMIGGIYRIDGDTLVLCIPDDDNTVRPDAFESLGGVAPSRSLWTLQRIKE